MYIKISIVNYVVQKGILHYNVANLTIITPKTVVLFARFVQNLVIVHQKKIDGNVGPSMIPNEKNVGFA